MESVNGNQVSMEDKLAARFAELEEKIKNMPQEEQDRVRDAYTYAKEHHDGQLRKDGSPYITHPLEVAHLVADLGLDADSIIAALLHDTIEDTDATHEEVAKRFGVTVANLVEGVTKLNKVKYTSTEEKQMENLRKMLMAMAQDVRVILIKICDRVHNIRTLEYQSEKKQREKALETLEIYAPIAHRLGMQRMKWEMEDESLRFLDPVAYKEISDELAAQAKAHAAFMERIQNEIQDRLKKEGIKGTVYGRVKHVYSIYRKMYAQNKKLSEIFDLYAFRVIVDDIPDLLQRAGLYPRHVQGGAWAALRTTSARPSPTCTSPSTPPSSAARASPLRSRSVPGRCTTWPSTAWRPTGSISRA